MELPKLNCDVDLDALDFEVLPWLMNFSDLKNHEETNLTNQTEDSGRTKKLFKCDVCFKNLSSKRNLKEHRRIHTGEKPHECDVCGKKFRRHLGLIIHKRIHTGEKPYECKSCHLKFAICSEWRNHRRIHENEKPVGCDFCEKRFTTKSSANSHMKKSHPS